MSVISLGKFTHHVAPATLEKYSEVQQDILWYLMKLTKVHRYHTKEAFREFLIRYLLIVDKPLETKAEVFIDEGILIDGVFENNYFCLTVKNLIELIGFEASSSLYNIDESLPDFINEFSYKNPLIISRGNGENEEGEPIFEISKDLFFYAWMGIHTLCKIENLNLDFREKVNNLEDSYVESVQNFVDYVMKSIPDITFDQLVVEHPDLQHFRDRHLKSDELNFDVYSLPQENLRVILEAIIPEMDDYNFLNEVDIISKEVMEENSTFNYMTHITFAIGVKWGYIELSNHPFSLSHCIDPLFDVEFDELLGPDGQLFTTQDIYDDWKMEKWQHLLPEKPI